MNTRRPLIPLLAAVLFAAPAGAVRAEGSREGYSYISYAGTDVSLVSKAEDDQTARVNMPILAGDQVTTGTTSRAEAILASGAVVRLDSRSDVRFERLSHTYESDDDRDLLVMSRGALSVELRDSPGSENAFRIDTDDATVLFPGKGFFRVDAGRRGTEVYVVSGTADVNGRGGHVTLRGGQYAWVSGSDQVEVENGDLPRDRFTRFVDERRDRTERPRASVSYVSSDYDYDYSSAGFEDYGSWTYVSAYNRYGWRPTVTADWSPYSQGYWRWSPVGLTWVSYEPWGWLPYHYGSWAYDAGFGWCWLPGSYYSPAWVYWNYTPGYIGWCPMGYYGYHDPYYRVSHHGGGGHGGQGHHQYPDLRGRVEVKQIDPRGWNYLNVNRVGARVSASGEILRADRVGFRTGETGVIATSPLRIERGSGSAAVAVQEAVRRVPAGDATGARGSAPVARVSAGLTSLLRRDKAFTPAAQEELKRASVTTGRGDQNPFRALPPETVASAGRSDAGGPAAPAGRSTSETPVRRGTDGTVAESPRRMESGPAAGGSRSWRESAGSPRRGGGSSPGGTILRREGDTLVKRGSPERIQRSDEGWRAPTSPSPRPIEPRGDGRVIRDDSGWRSGTATRSADRPLVRREAPSAPRDSSPQRTRDSSPGPAPRDTSPRPAPREVSPPPAREAPAPRAAPPSEAPRRQGAMRSGSAEGWRAAQRYDPPVPRSGAPASPPRYQARYESRAPQAPVRSYTSSPAPSRPSATMGSPGGSRMASPGGSRPSAPTGGTRSAGGSAPRSSFGHSARGTAGGLHRR